MTIKMRQILIITYQFRISSTNEEIKLRGRSQLIEYLPRMLDRNREMLVKKFERWYNVWRDETIHRKPIFHDKTIRE